jgi:GH24 family phage-related lysozyme (muramidase)
MSASAAMIAQLRQSEGGRADGGYYTDPAGNCTVGTGILVHHGDCTAAELAAHPDNTANQAALESRIHDAEGSVRSRVGDRALTQDQFDSLVSAVFNLGAGGAAAVLQQANRADDPGVVRALNDRIRATPRDRNGNATGPAVILPGLVRRRAQEARPFQTPQGPGR